MARIADPDLEEHILQKGLAVLDRRGPAALSMRSVAKAAGTTTPTLYDRFKNHDVLIAAISARINQELLARVTAEDSVEGMAVQYIRYASQFPHRYELLYKMRAKVWLTTESKPVYTALKKRIAQQLKTGSALLEEIALAVTALVHGGALFAIAMGPTPSGDAEVERATMFALKRILGHSQNHRKTRNTSH